MSDSSSQSRRALTRTQRLLTVLLGAGIMVVFGIAVWHTPAAGNASLHISHTDWSQLSALRPDHQFQLVCQRAILQVNKGQPGRTDAGKCQCCDFDLEHFCQYPRSVRYHTRTRPRHTDRIWDLGTVICRDLVPPIVLETDLIRVLGICKWSLVTCNCLASS